MTECRKRYKACSRDPEDQAPSISVQVASVRLLLSSICDISRLLKLGRWSTIKKGHTKVRGVVRG